VLNLEKTGGEAFGGGTAPLNRGELGKWRFSDCCFASKS